MKEQILSVGVDIGTTTTQLVFSKISIENIAKGAPVPRIKIVDKKIVYLSDIYRTPLYSKDEIDGIQIKKFLTKEYLKAEINASKISVGAIIITGEAARKKNANHVMNILSEFAGDFVVAIAGPDLESILAGKGSRAEKISKDKECVVANLDVGGGTTNAAIFENGEVIDTISFDVGGALIKFDSVNSRVSYVAPKIQRLAEMLDIEIRVGQERNDAEIERICAKMAGSLKRVFTTKSCPEESSLLVINERIMGQCNVDCTSFSGGVADYIYSESEELYQYNDIGVVLGREISKMCKEQKIELISPAETIRATVIGAGAYTTEISGSTITTTGDILPIKNIPILKLSKKYEMIDGVVLGKVIEEKLSWFNLNNENQQVALALQGVENPSFKKIQKLAKSISKGMHEITKDKRIVIVIIENDMAKALGQSLHKEYGGRVDVICIDRIKVQNGDYIDIGMPLANGRVVPVVVKTLVFNF